MSYTEKAKCLSFDSMIPNAETREAMRQAEAKDELTEYRSLNQLMKNLDES